jgi:prepilin-type N-terminal cleavage/methylation domain-containing protein
LRAKQRGFTLLEVLIAGFILFLVLSSMTLVYRGALISSDKAENVLVIASAAPSIRVLITESFRENSFAEDHEGAGVFGDLKYQWAANLLQIGRPTEIIQRDAGRELRYFLWNVELTVSYHGAVRTYHFREVSW